YRRNKNNYGYDVLDSYIMTLRPDIVITLCDIGYQVPYISIVQTCRDHGWKGRWIAYIPIDCGRVAPTWEKHFSSMDVIVSLSKWGQDLITSQTTRKDVCTISPGVDTQVYHPLSSQQRNESRKKYDVEDCFVIGAVGRNHIRKMWPVLLDA